MSSSKRTKRCKKTSAPWSNRESSWSVADHPLWATASTSLRMHRLQSTGPPMRSKADTLSNRRDLARELTSHVPRETSRIISRTRRCETRCSSRTKMMMIRKPMRWTRMLGLPITTLVRMTTRCKTGIRRDEATQTMATQMKRSYRRKKLTRFSMTLLEGL